MKQRGDYILFLDDDEIAAAYWLKLMLQTIKQYNSDAVFGRVLSHFDISAPEWIKKSYIFNRPSPAAGVRAIFTRTGNCIIKASLLKNSPDRTF